MFRIAANMDFPLPYDGLIHLGLWAKLALRRRRPVSTRTRWLAGRRARLRRLPADSAAAAAVGRRWCGEMCSGSVFRCITKPLIGSGGFGLRTLSA